VFEELASRSCPSLRPGVDKPIPRSSAIYRRVRPLVNASRTALRRTSGVGPLPFPMEHLLVARMEGRPLLSPDEIKRLSPMKVILLPERRNPIMAESGSQRC